MQGQRCFVAIVLVVSLVFIGGVATAMPPSPEVVKYYEERGELHVLAQKVAKMRASGVNQLEPLSFRFPARTSLEGDTARLRVLVILVDFSDNPASGGAVQNATAEDYHDILFSRDVMQYGSLQEFYLENSYGNLIIEGEVAGWYRMPHTYQEYHQFRYGTQGTLPNAQSMARDACVAADPDIDFSLYDNDNDGTVEGIFVVHAGVGAEEASVGDTLHIWSHAWHIDGGGYQSDDGVTVFRYSTEPEEASGTLSAIGVFSHEFGHTLGLPDLYDVSYTSAGIGNWGLMGGGSWNGGGRSPAHFCGWSKHVLDSLYGAFGQTIDVTSNLTDVVLGAAEHDSVRYRIMLPTVSGKECFLIENRRQEGFDFPLPGSGLLIWHCDDNIFGSNNLESNEHLRVALEQADGLFQLENNQGSGDAYDVYPGPLEEHHEFSDRTWPNTSSNYGASNQIAIWDIVRDPENGDITCNIDVTYSRANLLLQDVVFDDETYGNGDGIPNPGEHVEVYLTLENTWRDANHVLLTLSSPTPSVTFGENQLAFPLVLRGEQYTNSASPLDFWLSEDLEPINARFDFSFASPVPLVSTDSVLYAFLGGTEVLLVDDDDDNLGIGRPDWSQFYKDALDSLFRPYDYWDVKAQGTPGDGQLNYRFVIWYTGDSRPEQLSPEEVDFLEGYLDNGGKLFLTGQDIAEQLSATADSIFLRDYLQVQFLDSYQDLDVYGVEGSALSDGLQLRILGKDGAANQGSVDQLAVRSSAAEPAFTYMTSGNVASVLYAAPNGSRAVFFGFGFEGISSTVSGHNTRLEVMDRVLDFLGGSIATAVWDEEGLTLPADFALQQNYPNPFNPNTVISYTISASQAGQPLTLGVYNILGQEVERLVEGPAAPGDYMIEFVADHLSSGVYFYRIQVGEISRTRKMVLMK